MKEECFTVQIIQGAIDSNYLDVIDRKILMEAVAHGLVRQNSHTQYEWSDIESCAYAHSKPKINAFQRLYALKFAEHRMQELLYEINKLVETAKDYCDIYDLKLSRDTGKIVTANQKAILQTN